MYNPNKMKNYYYQIKDDCRKGLVRYLENVFLRIPQKENYDILDIGCGTGVPTIWIAENIPGKIIAVDIDKDALNYLQGKIENKNLQDIVKTYNHSFLDLNFESEFDIILAEGILNVVGFETGFIKVIELLKKRGYFIIHDEFKDHEKKCFFVQKNNCKLISSWYLDENVWWNDYYQQLEYEISKIEDTNVRDLFNTDVKEIEYYKSNPSPFRSIYYLILKQ
jgi:cyclopropane fatty-acyl-phospholipid synthase-like methyltransferase